MEETGGLATAERWSFKVPLEDILAPEYSNLPRERIEQIFEATLGDVSPEDLENFWGTLKNIGGAVSKALPQILPVAGTVVGTAFGGPAGAALGGALGSVAGRAIGGAVGPRPPAGVPPSAQRPPQTAPAAGQLMQTMFRPEMLQALMAMLMGQAGRRNIPVGGTPVPVGAFTNLLGVLANQAAAEYNAVVPNGGSPRYFHSFTGETMGDPAVAEHRAAALWELLQEADLEQRRFSTNASHQLAREDERELDDQLYDEMDLAELYSTYEF